MNGPAGNAPTDRAKAVVRIFRSLRDDDQPPAIDERVYVGGGLRLDQHHVLTCAHVVASALGDQSLESAAKAPEGIVWIDHFLNPDEPPVPCLLATDGWVPYKRPDRGDVAVLKVQAAWPSESSPAGRSPDALSALDGLDKLLASGVIDDVGTMEWADGAPMGRTSVDRYLIDSARFIRDDANRIRPGYSGGGVWSPDLGGYVGIMAAARGDRTQAAFIPWESVKKGLPWLWQRLAAQGGGEAVGEAPKHSVVDLLDRYDESLQVGLALRHREEQPGPIVFAVEGGSADAPDSFLRRLKYVAPGRVYPNDEPPRNPPHGDEAFRAINDARWKAAAMQGQPLGLINHLLGAFAEVKAADEAEAADMMARFLDDHAGAMPVAFVHHVYEGRFKKEDASLLEAMLAFWRRVANQGCRSPVVVLLVFHCEEAKGGMFGGLFRKRSVLQSALEGFPEAPDPPDEIPNVLAQHTRLRIRLREVDLGTVEQWLRDLQPELPALDSDTLDDLLQATRDGFAGEPCLHMADVRRLEPIKTVLALSKTHA